MIPTRKSFSCLDESDDEFLEGVTEDGIFSLFSFANDQLKILISGDQNSRAEIRTQRNKLQWFPPSTQTESMDFEEIESVMWRKVSKAIHISCFSIKFSFNLASAPKVFPGSWALVD